VNTLCEIKPRHVDGPNPGELERMEELAARVKHAIDFSRRLKLSKLQLDFEAAEELLQMMNDGIRTARQLQEQSKPDWRVGIKVKRKRRGATRIEDSYGVVYAVFPSGWGNLHDENGILNIKLNSGREILARADEWMTA
jgi:hypothetical protein